MWVSAVVGAVLVALVLREVFHTLFHPSGRGGLTMLVFRSFWATARRFGQRAMSLAGPAAMVAVITLWAGGLILGWALVYWPFMPGDFIFATSLDPRAQDSFVDALYLSWVTQATLGYGDIAPKADLLRIAAPLQATIGFALFTAAVTWVLSIYPALARRRSAASLIHGFHAGHERTGTPVVESHPTTLARRLHAMADAVSTCRVDLLQYPATFYFAPPAQSLSLAATLPHAAGAAQTGGLDSETEPAAAELAVAVDEFAESLASEYLGLEDADTGDVLHAYRRHHRPAREGQTA